MIKYKENEYKNFTENEHVKKHTKRENTYNNKCLYCNFSRYEVRQILKRL